MITIDTSERMPHANFEKLANQLGGTWNGEVLEINNELGTCEAVSYEYQPGFYVGTTNVCLTQEYLAQSHPYTEENYITIRLGAHGEWAAGRKGTPANEGIVLYNSPQEYSILYAANEPLQWVVIRFPIEVYRNYCPDAFDALSKVLEKTKPWFYYFTMVPEIEHLVRDIYQARTNQSLRRAIFLSKAIEIIGRLGLLLEKEKLGTSSSLFPDDIQKMFALKKELLLDYTIQPDLEKLSRAYGMSISKLQRTFKAIFNMPVGQFFNLHRIEEAHRMIEYTGQSLSEISYQLGFSHLSHLSKAFKNRYGYAPSTLRET